MMRNAGRLVAAVGMCVTLLAFVGTAIAVPLPPGTSPTAILPVTGTGPGVGDTLLATTGPGGVVGTPGPGSATTAIIRAEVYRNARTGGLDFYYQVTNTSPRGTDAINRETDQSFVGITILDATQTSDVFGNFVAGSQAAATVDRSPNGQTVGYNFVDPTISSGTLDPGETSLVKVIRTNALFFTTGSTQVIDGGVVGAVTFAPTVPEPASIVLLGTGLIGLAGWARRRHGKRS